MLVRQCTEDQIRKAANEVDVKLYELHRVGRGFRFQIKPGADRDKYKRTSASYFNQGRRVHACCWHGHRDFMRAIFRMAPEAVIRTSMAIYKGSANFEDIHRDTDRVIGAPIMPITYTETCECIYTR